MRNTKILSRDRGPDRTEEGKTGVIDEYKAAIAKVNYLKANSEIGVVIDALSFDEGFAEMSIEEQSNIAEAFFLGLEFKEDGNLKTPFRTLAAVKAAAGL